MTQPVKLGTDMRPIVASQFRIGQEHPDQVGGCGMAMSAGDMVPAHEFIG
jgi:hypothetical protein